MTSNTLDFSYAKNHLSEVFRRIVGSTRIYRIGHQRHQGEVAMISGEMLDGLLAENAILRDRSMVEQINQSRKARKENRLVEYKPKSRR